MKRLHLDYADYSKILAATALLAVVALGGCAPYEPYPSNVPSYQAPAVQPATGTAPPYSGAVVAPSRYAYNTGVVSSVELIRGQPSTSMSPAGTIIGAVVGGVLGNQIGEGRGRTAATVAGAAGGALAGNAIGQRTGERTADMYRIGIQYDNGGSQYIDVPNPGDLRPGDRVRVDNGQISRY